MPYAPTRKQLILAILLLGGMPIVGAAATLDGHSLTVSLLETPYDPATETVTVGAGAEISGNTGTNVGSLLFSAESVDASGLKIVYTIEGGGGAYTGGAAGCALPASCSLWSAGPDDARFLFSGLNFGTPGTSLVGVNLTAAKVFGASISDVTADSFVLNFGSAGIINGVPPLGTLTMDLQVQTITAVPLPAGLPLLLAGCTALGGFLRRRKHA
jgi:hypothetical protein